MHNGSAVAQFELDLYSPRTFLERYEAAVDAYALQAFVDAPSLTTAGGLSIALYNAVHDAAPEGARFAIMSSAGKDSSAAVHYYVESVLRRAAEGKRIIPATILTASVGHEFTDVEIRQRKEVDALNKWGAPYGIRAEIFTPHERNTVLVELLGNGMALPPKASNDRIVQASIANWCVDRVKRKLLDEATLKAASQAPVVIQVFGSRYDESTSRAFRMHKYSEGLPIGLTRVALTSEMSGKLAKGGLGVPQEFFGLYGIGHFTDRLIRDFVHKEITSYRGLDGNLELERIYRDASGSDEEGATECSIQRTSDGSFAGGCSNLATGTRLGCMICLKATNKALKNLAEKHPKRYAITYRVQQEINEHQRLVHARPLAVKASGFSPDDMFPKGFNFITRYRWLVMLLAADMLSGEVQLTEKQLGWIERRWKRHGVYTVGIADAKHDAALWIKLGGTGEPPVFFRKFAEHSCEFTHALGEGMPIGGYLALFDKEQRGLNLAHLMAFGITGGPVFPRVMAYMFDDVARPDDRVVMITDTPSVIGTKTSTGLLNGTLGATYRCVGVRTPTPWEMAMADGRHFFFRYSKKALAKTENQKFMDAMLAERPDLATVRLGDFLELKGKANKGAYEKLCNLAYLGGLMATLESANPARCGIDNDGITDRYFESATISALASSLTISEFKQAYKLIEEMVVCSDALQDLTESSHKWLIKELREKTQGNWKLLSDESVEGKSLRKHIHDTLKTTIIDVAGSSKVFNDYLRGLKDLAVLYNDGKMNTACASRMAYVIRESFVDEEYAKKDLVDLMRLLRLKADAVPAQPLAA